VVPWLLLPWWLIFAAAKILNVVLLAVVVLVGARKGTHTLSYSRAWRVAVYCLVTPVLRFWFARHLNLTVPYGTAVYWLIAGWYAYRGGSRAGIYGPGVPTQALVDEGAPGNPLPPETPEGGDVGA